MNDTPDDPRLPEPGGGDDDTTPIEPAAGLPAEPPYDSVELPPLAPLGDDLPPLDGDGDPPQRRLLSGGRLAVTAVLALVLLGGAAFAVTSGGDDDSDDDGIASVDDSESESESDSDGSSGSGEGEASQAAFEDAMLEYAQCMRDHGIDMPDPEFTSGGGGISVGAGPGGQGPNEDEFAAAEETCRPIIEAVQGVPDPPSAEETAELQDQLVEAAQCMRDKGYDMPDPEVSSDGRGMRIDIGSEDGAGSIDFEDPQFQADDEECKKEAGLEEGTMGGPAEDADS